MAKKREKPRHLGRGLQSLMSPIISETAEAKEPPSTPVAVSNFPPDKELRDSLQEISIDAILPNPYQARTVWNEQELEDLAESIRANGIIQPIIVRPAGSRLSADGPPLESRQVQAHHTAPLRPVIAFDKACRQSD